MSANKTTADNASSYSSQPAAQHTGKLDGILNKAGGLGNIIHGTGKIVHGHIPGAGDSARGGKAAIIAAGRQEVERGLDRIEGKPTDTSAAVHAPARDSEQGGVGDSTGAAAPRASTAATRADPTSQEVREAAADVRHPVDKSAAATATAGAAATGTRGHGLAPQQRHDERTQAAATTAMPHDCPIAANGPGVQRDTDMHQQGDGTVAGDQDKLDKETAATASPSDRLTAADGPPGAQRDTDVRQQGNGYALGDRFKTQETRTITDTPDLVNTVAGQEQPSGMALQP